MLANLKQPLAQQPVHILYIEDDIIQALLMQERLKNHGYLVDLATNGSEGLAKIKTKTYDLVAIDYRLPGDMDGIQVLQKLAELGLKVPTIMVTGEGSEQIAVAVMKLGASDYLIKDNDGHFFQLLPSVIERVLEKQKLLEAQAKHKQALYERDTIWEAVHFAAEQFLTATHWTDPILEVLARLGTAVAVNRVTLFENKLLSSNVTFYSSNQPNSKNKKNRIRRALTQENNPHSYPRCEPTNERLISQRHQWIAADITMPTDPSPLHHLSLSSISRWAKILKQNQAIYGLVRELPPTEIQLFASQQILSFAIVPIFVGNRWWGFISYEDSKQERKWAPVVIEAFKTAARILGAAIQHQKMIQALRDSEARLIKTQHLAHLGHCEWDLITNTRWLSEETLNILGLPQDNNVIDNQSFTKMIHQEDRKLVQKVVEQSLHYNKPYDIEFRIIRPDGTVRDVHALAELIRDSQQKPLRFVGTTQDITERKQVERALRENTQTLSAILNAATDSIVMMELDTTCLIINPAGAMRLGYTVEEVIGRRLCQLVPPEIAEQRKKYFNQVIENQTPLRFEDQENPQVWFEHSIYPVFNDNGIVTRIAVVSRDISERKQVEKALLDSKRRYESIFHHAEVSIWEQDFSSVLKILQQFTIPTVFALKEYFHRHHKQVIRILRQIIVNNVNNPTLRLLEARDRDELIASLPTIVMDTPIDPFIDGLCALWEKKVMAWQAEITLRTLKGTRLTALLSMPIPTTEEESRQVPVSLLDITQLKQVEMALRKERDFTDAIINCAGSLVLVLDKKGRIIRFNRTCEELTGYSFETVKNCYVWDFFLVPEEIESVKNYFARLTTTDSPARHENYWLAKNGERRLINWFNTVLTDNRGQVEYIIANGIDITERKQAEQTLKRILAEQQVILDNSPVAIAFLAKARKFLRVNRKLEEIFGYTETELKGQSTKILYAYQEDYENIGNKTYPFLNKGITCEIENQMRHKNGSIFWCRFLIRAIDPHDLDKGYIWNLEDITQQRQAEETLRLAAKVFETTNEMIVVTDTDYHILMVNPAFTTITGYSSTEIIGKKASFLNADNSDSYETIWETLQSTGKWQGEIKNRRKNGEVYIEWISIAAIRDTKGCIVQYVLVSTDITKRKQAEELIWWQANYDALTHLPNRTLFIDRLAQTIHSNKQHRKQLAIMFIDLDRFKWVNDNLGHDIGDQLLKETAQRLINCVRESDTVARLGGDEFTVIVTNLQSTQDVKMIAERILANLSHPFWLAEQEVLIGGSIGIAFYPEDGVEAKTLLKKADLAMYQAKEKGRNQYCFFSME
jgi:diguanylate cyclase (GGDEF)-like protein/PAS domain S-box-containing protein